MNQKLLYGTPTLLAALGAVIGWVFYRIITSPDDNAIQWRMPVDLLVYLRAGKAVAEGNELYQGSFVGHLPFTYPPISAVLFGPLSAMPPTTVVNVWQCSTLLGLFLVILMCMHERGYELRSAAFIVGILLTAAAWGLSPIHGTFFFGQINVLLMLLVAWDILPRKMSVPGVGIGLAAGIKLTPAFMGIILLIQRKWLGATVAFLTFLVTVGLGLIMVRDGMDFWTDAMFNSSRVGEHANPGAQSLRSVMERLWGVEGGTPWLIAVAFTLLFTVLGVWVAIKRRNRTVALALAGMCACLISPFSWFHHWVWIVPLSVAVFLWVNETVGHRFPTVWGSQLAALASVLAVVFLTAPWVEYRVWWFPSNPGMREAFPSWGGGLWCLWALIIIVAYAVSGYRDVFAGTFTRTATSTA